MLSARSKYSEYDYVVINLQKLYLRISFQCQIKAIFESSVHKVNSRLTSIDSKKGEAVFNQEIKIRMNVAKNPTIKATLVILKNASKKMVGTLSLDVSDDPIRAQNKNNYPLSKCPQKNVKLKMNYRVVRAQASPDRDFELDFGKGTREAGIEVNSQACPRALSALRRYYR